MLDEARHSRMLIARSAEMRSEAGLPALGFPIADSRNLFDTFGESRFLALVHRRQKRAARQFAFCAQWFREQGDGNSTAIFAAIAEDDQRQERFMYEQLIKLAGHKQARAELRAVAAGEAWTTWRRMGTFAAGTVYNLSMLAMYFVLGPLAALLTRGQARLTNWSR